MKKILMAAVLISFVLTACNEKKSNKTANKFSNPEITRIYELADYRKSEALLPYFSNPDVNLRQAAVLAFASIQDTSMVENLLEKMKDEAPEVRTAAAYALGQTPKFSSLTNLLLIAETENDPEVKEQILESIGKLTGLNSSTTKDESLTEDAIHFLDQIRFETEAERMGWAKAVFWINLSGNTDERLMNRMPFVLQKTEAESRVACAQAMSRHKGEWFNNPKNKKYVMDWCHSERNSDVRVFQMSMLGKINDAPAKDLLLGYMLSATQSQHVRVAAIRAASKMNSISSTELLPLLDDTDDYLLLECLAAMGNKSDVKKELPVISQKCDEKNAAVRALSLKLFAQQHPEKDGEEIWQSFNSSTTIFDKVHYAHALGAAPLKAKECLQSLLNEKEYALKYALAEAFIEMQKGKNLPSDLNYLESMIEIFNQKDIGTQALVAIDWREAKLSDAQKLQILPLLQTTLTTLQLPKEIETYNEIVRTINAISSEKILEKTAEVNHPIDWSVVTSIPAAQLAKVSTSKGTFSIELRVNDAPGSVASFVTLVKSGFYNDKYFHRVIPNFVIQGGCPRGDGMGSTDYTLRSEFALHDYRSGAVGLASSGRDTESCQWFVSHISTPHLEGRYTIFGYVTTGIEVVNTIQVGDKIISIELI